MFEKKPSADEPAASEKIDKDTAEKEFIMFCDNNRITYDESQMNDEEVESFKDIKKRFIEACQEGRVEVNGRDIKYTISDFSPEGFKGEVVTIKRPGGSAFSAMDSFKDKESIKKLHGFFSAQTGKDVSYFTKIDALDWKFLEAISKLFLSL